MSSQTGLWVSAVSAIVQPAGRSLGIELTPDQIERFSRLGELLVERNRVMNLTTIVEPDAVAQRHFVDSLTVVGALPELFARAELHVIDVGTGAGFPGLALAIAFPRWQVTMVDSIAKKIDFVNFAIDELALKNAWAFSDRIERFARSDVRESFDLAVARAVASTSVLAEYCAPLVRVGGVAALYKSGDVESELAAAGSAIEQLHVGIRGVVPISNGLNGESGHCIVVIDKIGPTPDRFPRRVGLATNRPL